MTDLNKMIRGLSHQEGFARSGSSQEVLALKAALEDLSFEQTITLAYTVSRLCFEKLRLKEAADEKRKGMYLVSQPSEKRSG